MKLLPIVFLAAALQLGAAEQMIVSIATDWNASSGRLQLFEKVGGQWKPASQPWRVLYGKDGLAWGRGPLFPATPPSADVPVKRERDRRAPAGLFSIGTIYTYDRALPTGADYPFHTITNADAWIDDPALPDYNRHVRVDPANPPAWFASQRMRLDDPPHRWLVEIRHNSDPPVAGAGSAIFFHIQRGPERRSAGCTVMPQDRIVQIVQWLRTGGNPRYVLLPKQEYLALWKKWDLPSPQAASALLSD